MKIKRIILLLLIVLGTSTANIFAQQPHDKDPHKQKSQKTEQPSWMKDKGYGDDVKNVYFPKQDMYYNVKKQAYIYKENGKWIESKKVPSKYSNVDFKNAKQVKLTKKTNKPQKSNSEHKNGSQGSKPSNGSNPQRK